MKYDTFINVHAILLEIVRQYCVRNNMVYTVSDICTADSRYGTTYFDCERCGDDRIYIDDLRDAPLGYILMLIRSACDTPTGFSYLGENSPF
jgi:hypothetical protein